MKERTPLWLLASVCAAVLFCTEAIAQAIDAPAKAGAGAAAELQRLIPWSSLGGQPHPDEAALEAADWTTRARQGLAPRIVQTLADNWTFNYFPAERLDVALLAPATDDTRWPVVALPHTWHTFETTREVHPFIARPSERDSTYWWHGWGVYRKHFLLDPKTTAGRRVFAEFDGVMKYCRVWLNGREVGEHKGGYASFCFEVTPFLQAGTNVLAVAVSARRDDEFRTPPMTAGNFNVYGGIYREVRLVVKSAVHIPFQGSFAHEGGTFVTTPTVSAERGTVRVRTWVKNDAVQPRLVTLRTTLRDPAARQIAVEEARKEISPGAIHEFDQPQFAVPKPRLWSPETPALYSVESEVLLEGKVVDLYASPLGFRWFEWNHAENRGYLNGKRLHLHGSNRLQEFPWLGDALPKWMHIRDMADMRFGQNHNFLRPCVYTQDALVYDLADRYGVLICEDVPNIKHIDFNRDLQRQQVIEMIRRDRNHPSIVMWSMGNETSHPADSAWAQAEDDTRIIHARHADPARADKFVTHTDRNMDMENLLRCTVRGWTDRDVAALEPKDCQHAGTEEWQYARAMVQDGSQRGRIDMPNGMMWLYADNGADREYVNCPLKHINPKGWADLYRIPKYMYYLWQANYWDQPMVFVHPHFWQSRYLGQKQDFIVDSNCESVELSVNGRSLGIQRPGASNFWNVTFVAVPVERGELTVVGRKGSQVVTRRLPMAGPPARLTLSASHSALAASRDSVAVMTADVVDENGAPVLEFSRDLRWEVSGPATLISPGTYQSDLNRREETNGVFYIVAPVSALLRATGEPGDIAVTVRADGVAPGVLKLRANAAVPAAGFVTELPLSGSNRQPIATAPAEAPSAQDRFTPSAAAPVERTAPRQSPMLKPARQDIVLPAGKTGDFYKSELLKWFTQNGPSPMIEPAFTELVNVLVEHLIGNGGLLVADDFNHRVQQYNDVVLLHDFIVARRLPDDRAQELDRSYARRIIRQGETLRIADEMERLRTLPAGTNAGDQVMTTTVSATAAANVFSKSDITLLLKKVNDYQVSHPVMKDSDRNWERGTWYAGLMAAYHATGDRAYLDQALRWSEKHKWQPGTEGKGANKLTCTQTYLELFFLATNHAFIEPTIQWLHSGQPNAPSGVKVWYLSGTGLRYADSLFVGAPTLAMLAKATGDDKYLDWLNAFFWDVHAEIFDSADGLLYRDKRYIGKTTSEGKKVFWSRGNGWVYAGLPRIISYLPKDEPSRAKFEALFKRMSSAIAKRQPMDGLWRPNLDDPQEFSMPETSGTGFFCYGLAWGINHGVLDRGTYLPVVKRAWDGLVRSVSTEGKVQWGQLVDHQPGDVKQDDSHEYVTGAFLLAGSEVLWLVKNDLISQSSGTGSVGHP
jgi:rhamnogalacturonyl hydrolase YesR